MRWLVAALVLTASTAYADATGAMLRLVASSAVQVIDKDGSGSGVVVAPNTVLTCAHVVLDDKDKISTTLAVLVDISSHALPATVIRYNTDLDLALINVPGLDAPAVKLGDKDPQRFDSLWMIGAPHGMRGVAAPLILDRKDTAKKWLFTGWVSPGASGAPVVSETGELACLVRATYFHLENDDRAIMGECVGRLTIKVFLAQRL